MELLKKKTNIAMKRMQLIALGAIVVGISTIQLFGAANSIGTRFFGTKQPETITVATASTNNKCDADEKDISKAIPTHITINKAQIDLPIVSVALNQGTWEVKDGVANYALETSRVSSVAGNVGIFGHDRANAFNKIKVLTQGDLITITTATGQKATYKVKSLQVTDPTNVETFYPTKKPTLTLVTCDGLFSEQRYVIKAELVSLEKGNCHV